MLVTTILSFFPNCFQPFHKQISKYESHLFYRLYVQSEILLLGPLQYKKNVFVYVNGWLVVLGFNATLTAKVISWQSVTHMCFLAFSHQY